jgi:rfaE bifunctional protein nucleotidyltransferase chain/domain
MNILKRLDKKIKTIEELVELKNNSNEKFVVTNGCFSYFHYGHLKYLNFCAEQGDKLIVCIDSDERIRQTKGYIHFIPEQDRAYIIAGLDGVDYVTIFNKPFVEILKRLQPEVYVKGGDYSLDTINSEERGVMEQYETDIRFSPKSEGWSTRAFIEKIKKIELGDLK